MKLEADTPQETNFLGNQGKVKSIEVYVTRETAGSRPQVDDQSQQFSKSRKK